MVIYFLTTGIGDVAVAACQMSCEKTRPQTSSASFTPASGENFTLQESFGYLNIDQIYNFKDPSYKKHEAPHKCVDNSTD